MASRILRAPAPNEAAAVLHSFTNHLLYSLAKDQYSATARDRFMSLALTVRDVTRPISLTMRGYPAVRASTSFRQSDFGIKPYRALLGALKVADEVRVEIEITL